MICAIYSRKPGARSGVLSPLEIKRVVQWQISSVFVARRIFDVKAETLTDTSRARFAHAFNLTFRRTGKQDFEGVRVMLGQQR
jgi:hypothetical protein